MKPNWENSQPIMPSVCLYLTAHLPLQLRDYPSTEIGKDDRYFDEEANMAAVNQLADESILPVNRLLALLIERTRKKFKVSFSLSGLFLELMQKHRPDVIQSFKSLAATGCIDFLGEPYYHSCSSLYSKEEFNRQVDKHQWLIKELFGIQPVLFRNTEMIHSNELVSEVKEMGFQGMITEGAATVLKGRDPNRIYAGPDTGDFPILLRNRDLSDDIAFRFDQFDWNEFPLTAEKFARWIHLHPQEACLINLMLNYTTFGIHKTPSTGIFAFLEHLPEAVLAYENAHFALPAEAFDKCYPKDIYDVPQPVSWRNQSTDCIVWNRNLRQHSTLKKIAALENLVKPFCNLQMMETWGRLQAVDYLLEMSDGNMVGSPAGMNFKTSIDNTSFQNILTDFEVRLIRSSLQKIKKDTIPFSMGALY